MAETADTGTPYIPGLMGDPTKINPTGADPEQLQSWQQAQKDAISALQHRYDQPNWFQIAAGFAKPQLGGFLASLGSASNAYGQQVEKQRDTQAQVAQMKSQLAQSNILVGQNKDVSNEISQWQNDHPGETLPVTLLSKWKGIAPNLPAVGASAEATQTNLQINQQRLAAIRQKQDSNIPLTPADEDFLNTYKYTTDSKTNGKTQANTGQSDVNKVTPNPLVPSGEIKANTGTSTVPNEIEPPLVPSLKPYYPLSVPMPTTQGKGADDKKIIMEAYQKNALEKEAPYAQQVAAYTPLATGGNLASIRSEYDSTLNMMEKNPELTAKVMNIVRQSGPIANALNAGTAIHFGNLTANVSLPIEEYIKGGLSANEQTFADTLLSHMVSIGLINMKQSGVPMQSGMQQLDMATLGANAHIHDTPEAAHYRILKDKAKFEANMEWLKIMSDERKRINPNSLTPLSDINNSSPLINTYHDKWQKVNDFYDKSFNDKLGSGEKP